MKRVKKEVPAKNLYVALLDDDPWEYSCRYDWIKMFIHEFNLSYDNTLVTRDAVAFTHFVNDYNAFAFADPGVFGGIGRESSTTLQYKTDRHIAKWLRLYPNKTLYVPFHIPLSDYADVETFELENVESFSSEYGRTKVYQILSDWLFENNPVKLFYWNWMNYADASYYVKKLKNPALTAVCENLSIRESTMGIRTIKEKRQALHEHYNTVWKESMKRS